MQRLTIATRAAYRYEGPQLSPLETLGEELQWANKVVFPQPGSPARDKFLLINNRLVAEQEGRFQVLNRIRILLLQARNQ